MVGVWVLMAVNIQSIIGIDSKSSASKMNDEDDRASPEEEYKSADRVSQCDEYESDELLSEFERNLWKLMPGLQEESSSVHASLQKGTRHSERKKHTFIKME